MKKAATLIAMGAMLVSASSASADSIPNRPPNATGNAPAIDARVNLVVPDTVTTQGIGTDTVGYWEVYYQQPSTITVSIYTLDSMGNEGTYQYNKTVDFTTYVKDVLPNEWTDSWGNTTAGMNSLKAGALAVKTFGWYHVINWMKDPNRNAHVTNGVISQVYKTGSNKPNSNSAVNAVADEVIVNSSGYIFETGYRNDVSSPGSLMSQNGSYLDAMNGMWYTDIVKKWYSSYGGKSTMTRLFII